MEHKCKNCKLFASKEKRCMVIILYDGQKINLPVDDDDDCFFEKQFIAKTPAGEESFNVSVEQVKFWVEDPVTGEKTNKDGKVKIEYPVGFFGKEKD